MIAATTACRAERGLRVNETACATSGDMDRRCEIGAFTRWCSVCASICSRCRVTPSCKWLARWKAAVDSAIVASRADGASADSSIGDTATTFSGGRTAGLAVNGGGGARRRVITTGRGSGGGTDRGAGGRRCGWIGGGACARAGDGAGLGGGTGISPSNKRRNSSSQELVGAGRGALAGGAPGIGRGDAGGGSGDDSVSSVCWRRLSQAAAPEIRSNTSNGSSESMARRGSGHRPQPASISSCLRVCHRARRSDRSRQCFLSSRCRPGCSSSGSSP